MVGSHLLKCWSSTQAGVAMSSGEAEFYGAVKGASAGLGMRALYKDIGYDLPLRLWTDSSAAVGICSRQGLGKLRHLECTSLWIQQRIRHGELEVRKIAGEFNPADLYTKHLESKAKIEQLVSLFGGEFREGRAESAPQLREDPATANMVEVLYSSVGASAGTMADMRILPHLMTREEMDDMSEVVRIDSSENQWTKESGQLDVRPAAELADPGPRGTFEPTPARLVEFALNVSGAFTIDRVEDSTGEAQGMGAAQGMGEAQGVGVAQDTGVTRSVGENDAILHIDSEDTDAIDSHAKLAIDYFGKYVLGPVGECVPVSGTRQDDRHSWPAHRWPPGHRDPGSRPVRGACVCYPESAAAQCGNSLSLIHI